MEIPQDLRNMSPAMKEMDDLMTRHQLLHVHNTCFRWTFGNVRCHVDGNGNIKPLKNKSIGRIDPPVAAIISIAVWMIMRTKHTYDTGLYLEDLLLLAGSGCFTAAAALAAGCAAALATAGACLTVYALVVARSAGRR